MTLHQRLSIAAALALVATACSGGSGAGVFDSLSSTTTPEATTVAPEPTTTIAPTSSTSTTTTTTIPAVDDEAVALLADINAAMAAATSLLAYGEVTMSGANDPDVAYVTVSGQAGQSSQDDYWMITMLEVAEGAYAGAYVWEQRGVNGMKYEQDAATGIWEIAGDNDPDPVEDTLDGALVLADVNMAKVPSGYRITGTYPADPTVQSVEIVVGADDLLVKELTYRTEESAAESNGLIPQSVGNVVSLYEWGFQDYGIEIGEQLPPPVGAATSLTAFDGAFLAQIPVDWERSTRKEIITMGYPVDKLWVSSDDILLSASTEDLVAEGYGKMTVDEYFDLLLETAFADAEIGTVEYLFNGQGEPVVLVSGVPTPGEPFVFLRIMTVRDRETAFNITFVAPAETVAGNIDLMAFVLNSLLFDG